MSNKVTKHLLLRNKTFIIKELFSKVYIVIIPKYDIILKKNNVF